MPSVPDLVMTDETFADFSDTVKVLEAKGYSRAEAVNEIVSAGLKKYAKQVGEFRAFAAKQGEIVGA